MERFAARFGVDLITEFRIRKGKLRFEHPDNPSSISQSAVLLELMKNKSPERLHEMGLMEGIRVISRPEGIDGKYTFEAGNELRDYVRKKLEGASTLRGFTTLKGTLGERIVPFILKNDWELIMEHSNVLMGKALSCHRPGPDNLIALKTTRELYHFEVKWYKNLAQAMAAGSKDACEYRPDKRASNKYGKVVGAYVAALDWNPEKTDGDLHVKRAK
jgi:hypothetical protein